MKYKIYCVMEQKNVFVQVIYPRSDGSFWPCLNLYHRDLNWIKWKRFHLDEEGAVLVEYEDGIRTAMCRVVNGDYVDITL